MSGMAVPSTRVVPTGGGGGGGGGGGTTVLPRVSGEDITRIYIDSVAGGSAIGGISADYMIELKGKNGLVTSKAVYTYPLKVLVAGVVAAAAGTGAIETSIAYGLIGNPTGTIRMFVETTDWEKKVDSAVMAHTALLSETRSAAIIFSDQYKLNNEILGSGTLLTCFLGDTPVIDGDFVSTEWDDTDTYAVGGTEFIIHVKRDSTNFYYCVLDTDDTSTTPDINQDCEVYWDTLHNQGSVPGTDDIRYTAIYQSGTWHYYYFKGVSNIWNYQGDITTIAAGYDTGIACWVYEGSIPLSMLNNGGSFDGNGDTIGFAVRVDEAGTSTFASWPSTATHTDPSTWGDIVYTPEFPTIAIPIVFCVIPFVVFRAKRRGRHE